MMKAEVRTLIELYEAEFENQAPDEALEPIRARISDPMLARYDSMKQRFGKSVMSPLQHGACSACHMQVSNAQRLKLAENVVICETCGRLIYDPEILYGVLMEERNSKPQSKESSQ
ncbi:hypothetical protein JXA32_11950 [Candidatus Sumerlaeota bacterium]|nr:hypothetical protein [Candidatus Sumerlaeota bacterium]